MVAEIELDECSQGQELDREFNAPHEKPISIPLTLVTGTILGFLITFLTFVIVWPYAAIIFTQQATDIPSIACDYAPPNVSLPNMHYEIRQLLLADYFYTGKGALLMNGGFVTYRYNTDVEKNFRQESNFLYLTGYAEPNATVVIDIASKKSFLFIENHPDSYAIWNGEIQSPSEIAQQYNFDAVYYHEDLNTVLGGLSGGSPSYIVYVMDEYVTFPGQANYTVNTGFLANSVHSRRETKTDRELQLMRYSAQVSSGAHSEVMRFSEPGLYEYNIEGKFLDGCFACGLTNQAYLPICASGNNSAILHYNANDRRMLDGDFLLIDAGGEYYGYGTDITRTFPVNGTFSLDQEEVYNMVLRIQLEVIGAVRPGLTWGDLQGTAVNSTCQELVSHGYLTSSVSDCISLKLYYYFFPHGVSHYVGLDVHDTSGIGSVKLEERNVITIEPGIYFNEALLVPVMADPALGKYFGKSRINSLLNIEFGGVRIEDVIVVWKSGAEVISNTPKTVLDIENLMRQKAN